MAIQDSLTFAHLSAENKQHVLSFFQTHKEKSPSELSHALYAHFKNHPPIKVANVDSTKTLLNTPPVLIEYLSNAQLEGLYEELILAYFKLCSDYQLHQQENRKQHLSGLTKDIERCEFLINLITNPNERQVLIEKRRQSLSNQTQQSLIVVYAKLILEKLREISAGMTVYLRQWMNDFSLWRFYWSWTGTLLNSTLAAIPSNFPRTEQNQKFISGPRQTLSYLGWGLGYLRLLIQGTLLLKHTIAGPWMKDEEKQKPLKLRIQQQLQQRKFNLISDLIWGIMNLALLLWLIGNGLLGYLGKIFTVILIFGDALITNWRITEAKETYLKALEQFTLEINRLEEKIDDLLIQTNIEESARLHQVEILREQRKQLIKAKQEKEREWSYAKQINQADLAFSAGMLIAYFIATAAMVPTTYVSAITMTVLSVASAMVGFFLTLAYNFYKAYLEIAQTENLRTEALTECKRILSQTEPLSEIDYLHFKQLETEVVYQEKHKIYLQIQLIRSVLIDSFIPLFIFTAFTFAPFGWAIAILAVGVVAAMISHKLISNLKPERSSSLELEFKDFDQFKKEDALKNLNTEASPNLFGLFNTKKAKQGESSLVPSPETPKPRSET